MPREERNYLAQYLSVIDANTSEMLGYLGDMSKHGLMFITTEPLEPEMIKIIRIENTITDEEQPAEISVKATIKILWNKPNLNPEMNCVGCAFLQIDDTGRELLENLVADIKFGNEVEIHRTIVQI